MTTLALIVYSLWGSGDFARFARKAQTKVRATTEVPAGFGGAGFSLRIPSRLKGMMQYDR